MGHLGIYYMSMAPARDGFSELGAPGKYRNGAQSEMETRLCDLDSSRTNKDLGLDLDS